MRDNLIIDVGMHDGSDTAYYLHCGHNVVAIEADPQKCATAKSRFHEEINSGKLIIENVGIAPEPGFAQFWINEHNPSWSSFDREFGCRKNTKAHAIEVAVVRFRSILERHGVPHYLKIDIEGNDYVCLEDLRVEDVPQFISIEAHKIEYLCELHRLGYTANKVVNQAFHNRYSKVPDWRFPPGSSGPFAQDTPGEWQSLEDAAYDWLHINRGFPWRSSLGYGWYDFHATNNPGVPIRVSPMHDGVLTRGFDFCGRLREHIKRRYASGN